MRIQAEWIRNNAFTPGIFISYRRKDTALHAGLIHESLEAQYGRDQVKMDVDSIAPGVDFVREVERLIDACDVVLVLIGPFWAATREGRERLRDPKDLVRQEVAAALRASREKRTSVVPLFISDASLPSEEELPPELRGLERLNGIEMRDDSWRQSTDRLLRSIERALAESAAQPQAAEPGPPPPREHFAQVVRSLSRQSLVVLLGEDANVREYAGGSWQAGVSKSPPRYSDLATYLSNEFRLPEAGDDLPAVADEVEARYGLVDLYRALRKVLLADYSVATVHRSLARLPSLFRDRNVNGLLLVTFNYDDILERAFGDAGEPYDVVSYIARGEDRGRFLHRPWEGEPIVVSEPNRYVGLPIDEDLELERTVIMRLLGGVNRTDKRHDEYVVSQRHEIDFATRLARLESSVPLQIIHKLRESHLLFLGVRPQAYFARVILDMLTTDYYVPRSWAVQPGVDPSRGEWRRRDIEVFDTGIAEYTDALIQEAGAAP